MSLVIEEIQLSLQSELRKRLPAALFEQWFSGTEIVRCDDGKLELGVKNRFFKSWIETKYLSTLREAATAVLGRDVLVTVSVSARLYAPFREAQEKAMAEAPVPAPELRPPEPPVPARAAARYSGMDLNPDFTFESLVVGESNRIAQAVALRAVESPAAYGRLYFCGEHGVGKTHLLQAMCHETLRRRPEARVVYVTCERFVADFGAAHAGGRIGEFREFYRGCDLLAIDQLQALGQGNKTATQVELSSILDDLAAHGRQVVGAAILAPAELEGVDDRLGDRFGAGFVDCLAMPDEGIRRDFIVRRLAGRGIGIPEEAVGVLARDAGGNLMRLEGAVNRLAALIEVGGMPPNLSCLRMALDVSTVGGKRGALTIGDIVGATAEEFGLTAEAVCGRGRTVPARTARAVAVVLCRRLLRVSYVEIGGWFGGRSHATVISMVKKVSPLFFAGGVESRPVERILFRLGVSKRVGELLERQDGLF